MKTNIIFFIISRSIHLRIRNVSDKSCRKTQNTQFKFSNFFFENHAVGELMWKNVVQPERSQMTICALHAGYLRRQTLSEYLILIFLPLQQWLQQSASV
jgi:hypothetical protein